jgi:FkbM family methyltransferase
VNRSVKSLAKRVIPRTIRVNLWRLRKPQRLGLKRRLGSGLKIAVTDECDWTIYNDIFVDGEYDVPINALIEGSPPNRGLRVVDIGANVGFFTLRFIHLMRQNGRQDQPYHVTLLEGSPKLTDELQLRLIVDNSLEDNVRIVNGLVGKRQGSGTISEQRFHAKNTIFHEGDKTVQVEYVDLDAVVGANTFIDLLKCDIEGAEQLFIENYSNLLRRVQFAVFELHPHLVDIDSCMTILRRTGFTQHRILRATGHFLVLYCSR